MMELPKHILDTLQKGKISVGRECFPPDEEDEFSTKLVKDFFERRSVGITESLDELKEKLSKILKECTLIEEQNKGALEKLCEETIVNLFEIPEDTITIDMELVDSIDTKSERMLPEKTTDFTFDSIGDMESITSEVYKRRMLNALIEGAAIHFAEDISLYISGLFNINSELPSLYKKMLLYNDILLYADKDSLSDANKTDAGTVDVYLSAKENMVTIKSRALLMPILLEETIKGLLELSIAHGLPKNKIMANYVIGKADFKLAEIWDMRIGMPLWEIIWEMTKDLENNPQTVGLNHFFMELSMLQPEEFNEHLKNIFAHTNSGKKWLAEFLNAIAYEKGSDDFDEYMRQQSDQQYQITDGEYYDPSELIQEYTL